MATTIGTFQKTDNSFNGEVVTLELQSRNVRILPDDRVTGENAPSHRVFAGRVEVGAAWSRQALDTGRPYLSVKLDDPSFSKPIYANLVEDGEGGGHTLIWSRPERKND